MQNKVFDAYDSLFSVRFFSCYDKNSACVSGECLAQERVTMPFLYIEYSRWHGYEVLKKYVYILK